MPAQGIAMIVAGGTPPVAMRAIRGNKLTSAQDHYRKSAEEFLRHTPSYNIIPFRSGSPNELSSEFWSRGADIGWELLRMANPLTFPPKTVSVRSVGNQQKWHTLESERSGFGWRSGKFPECPVVASSPFYCLSMYLPSCTPGIPLPTPRDYSRDAADDERCRYQLGHDGAPRRDLAERALPDQREGSAIDNEE